MLRSLLEIARPKGMALVALLPIVGFSFAFWDHGCTASPAWALPRIAWLAVLWAVPHAGTMWLNAELDRDQGEVLFGRAVAVPRGIGALGYATLVLATLAAFATSVGLGCCVLGCATLSVLYSHPRTAWKGHALGGPLVNAVGYGVLSPLGGFFLAGLPPSPRGVLVLATSVAFIAAAYLAAQAFQEREDRERGYRTLVALRGARATLAATRACLAVAVALTLGLALAGWFPRAVLVSAPAFFAADRVLVRWSRLPGGGDASWAAKFFVRLTLAGVLCLAAACVDYVLGERSGAPLGGLATPAGHPSEPACGSVGGIFAKPD